MKSFSGLLLLMMGLSVAGRAQRLPADSSARNRAPDVVWRGTSFYRSATDPNHVVRAGLDNMPVRTPDSSEIRVMPNRHVQPKRSRSLKKDNR